MGYTYKQKILLIKKIIHRYQCASYLIDCMNYDNHYASHTLSVREAPVHSVSYYYNNRIDKIDEAKRLIYLINQIFVLIGKESEAIIRHDFMMYDKEWYLDYYSKATYYRKRKEAIEQFVKYLLVFLEF